MSIGGGSYFKGWVNTLPNMPSAGQSGGNTQFLIGHVLKVDYTDDIGKITVRLIGLSKELNDDDINVTAYPLDANTVKYPIPGETVLIVEGIRNLVSKSKFVLGYYYTTAITSHNSITFNSDPYIGQSVSDNIAKQVYTLEYEQRFENRLVSLASFTTGQKVRERPPLKPYEGDFVLQGRFGSSIRLGSTIRNSDNEWSAKGGESGNPIMIVSSDMSEGALPVSEKVNDLNSSIYLCSTQAIPVVMSTSRRLKSHLYRYDVVASEGKNFSSDESDKVHFVPTPELPWASTAIGGATYTEQLQMLPSELFPPNSPTNVSYTYRILGPASNPSMSRVERPGRGQYEIRTGLESQFSRRSVINTIILHYTVSDHEAWKTIDFLGTNPAFPNNGGIHYAVDGWGGVSPGIVEESVCDQGNWWNTSGIGIEMSLIGAVTPIGDGRARTKEYSVVIPAGRWVDLGFFYHGDRYYQDFTDEQIQATEVLINNIMDRHPHIRAAIRDQNLWSTTFNIPTGKPPIKIGAPDRDLVSISQQRYEKSEQLKKIGIFSHSTTFGGSHADTVPTPKLVDMLVRLGMVSDDIRAAITPRFTV